MLSLVQPAAGVFNEILAALLNGQIVRSRTQSRNKIIPTATKISEEISQRSENTDVRDVSSGNIFLGANNCEAVRELGSFLRSNKVEFDQTLSTRPPKIHLKVDGKCFLLSMTKSGGLQIQRRGFRTKTLESKIQAKKDTNSSSIFSYFGITSDIKTAWRKSVKQESLKTILDSTELKGSEKTKVAFAEGYFAGALRKTSKFGFSSFLLSLSLVVEEVRFSLTSIGQISPEEVSVTFNDVKGIDEVKEEVVKIVDYLKDPTKYTRLGARLPKGILLVGLPGSGKTLLAKAIAGEAQVPFFRTSGSEFEEMLVGLGAKRVRDLFSTARSRAPCVIFIDEIDSVGSKRSYNATHPYANQTINQLLTEMDGFLSSNGVIVLAATNRRDDLDPALLRPGRFDVEIQVPWPDLKGRIEIFSHYLSKVKTDADVNAEALAKSTVGFSGAEIENMINQAALKAASDNKPSVDMHYLDMAHDFVRMGPARKALPTDKDTNLNTAYHEAGHALVAYFTKDSVPLHKVTIVPRGQTLGHTSYRPEKESYGQSKSELLASMDVAMGGRAAEELIFGTEKVTTGAMSDLSAATRIVEQMVRNCGMSDKAGFRFFRNNEGQVFNSFPLSPATAELLDNEIRRLLQESYERAKQVLKANAAAHKRLAEALLEFETLNAEEMKTVIEGRPLNKKIEIS